MFLLYTIFVVFVIIKKELHWQPFFFLIRFHTGENRILRYLLEILP